MLLRMYQRFADKHKFKVDVLDILEGEEAGIKSATILIKGKDAFGKDYFRELLERVRSIRASERRIYQQITDIFAECSIDYDKDSQITQDFYATVQNKFHYAITGQTAAEIIYTKADHTKEYMGLTTWKHSPEGRILKSDVSVAKNYLPEKEIKRLERTVYRYLLLMAK